MSLHTFTLIKALMALTEMLDAAGQISAATAVSKAWQDTAHCHLAASLAAAVPVPPMPASVPAAGANPPRHVLADLYLHTKHAVFDSDFQGTHPSHHSGQ